MDSNQTAQGPGVRIPPPLYYLAFFAGGIALDRIAPLPIPASPLPRYVGAAFMVASLAIAALAFKQFAVARTTVRPDRPASALIQGGIFGFSRNPLYLSLLLLYLGLSLSLALWWPVILSGALILTIDRFVIRAEERHLAERFGHDYAAYRSRVRRWL
jgi:protein-S-isoprenylcysteine O-methyltransferase Ste14